MNCSPYEIDLELAGIPISLHIQYKEAYSFFKFYESRMEPSYRKCESPVKVDESDWKSLIEHGFVRGGKVEASYLSACCSDALMEYDRCIIHAAAFRDNDGAWLITAPPGVGKSTQVKTLRELYPNRYSVICGDRPVVWAHGDHVTVYPSPWNGKEGWGGASAAQLKGIICLHRGNENCIRRIIPRKAIVPIYQAVIQTTKDRQKVECSTEIVESILSSVPIWDFTNRDIPESTVLLYEKVLKENIR